MMVSADKSTTHINDVVSIPEIATTTIGTNNKVTRNDAESTEDSEKEEEFSLLVSCAEMREACKSGDLSKVQSLLRCHHHSTPSSHQDQVTGQSPLMIASASGNLEIVRLLLEAGAPWNALDRQGKCAGNYAMEMEHWQVVDFLVNAATAAELILGASLRSMKQNRNVCEYRNTAHLQSAAAGQGVPVESEPSTKPNYLQSRVRYHSNSKVLLDEDDDAVMMEWERPLMQAHASILFPQNGNDRRILNVGFGMGIIDEAIQRYDPALHVIIEAHPIVYQKMLQDRWNTRNNVRLLFGKWQEVLPTLLREEGLLFDGIFFDTYGEDSYEMEDFHSLLVRLLEKKETSVYSFFNGLAPDNLFFHGVACQCFKLQLAKLGFDTEFAPCEIQVNEKEWEGVRRKYWHGRSTYYLPIVTWNIELLSREENREGKNLVLTANGAVYDKTTKEVS